MSNLHTDGLIEDGQIEDEPERPPEFVGGWNAGYLTCLSTVHAVEDDPSHANVVALRLAAIPRFGTLSGTQLRALYLLAGAGFSRSNTALALAPPAAP